MAIPSNITKEHIDKAIKEIIPAEIPQERLSVHYFLIHGEITLPPKYVISIANKFVNNVELDSHLFTAVEAKNFLIKKNYNIVIKQNSKNSDSGVWIEKTIVHGRFDRNNGDRALGKAIWSPQKSKSGVDIYKNMRLVQKGDIVIHLIDNKFFCGVSIVKEKAAEADGIDGTEWSSPSFLIKLEGYYELIPPIDRKDLLNARNKIELDLISASSEVFYNKKLDLRQGAYLTPCPDRLLTLINQTYKIKAQKNMPYIKDNGINNNNASIHTFNLLELDKAIANSGLKLSKRLLTRFTASLLTKRFVILTGLSGSGKTKLVQAFAMWICENDNQYCLVPVGADWTNREPLIGFPNALVKGEYVKPDNGVLDLIIRAIDDNTKPYFLILDEMNLSHVERYFADFLSVMESDGKMTLHPGPSKWNDVPPALVLPKNLFIVGTVNIDETTYMFSPKVLDRASVIEFRVTPDEMHNYLKYPITLNLSGLKSIGATMANSFVDIATAKIPTPKDQDSIQKALLSFFIELKKTGAEFGYRSASEILRFAAILNFIEPKWTITEIIDAAIMQKLLPKVHGSRRKLEPVLKTLGMLCLNEGQKIEDYIGSKSEIEFQNAEKINYPISFEKILRMYNGLIDNGFTSYAEA